MKAKALHIFQETGSARHLHLSVCHGGTPVSTAASQQERPGFELRMLPVPAFSPVQRVVTL